MGNMLDNMLSNMLTTLSSAISYRDARVRRRRGYYVRVQQYIRYS